MEEDVSKLNKWMLQHLIISEVVLVITLVMWFNPFNVTWATGTIKFLWIFMLVDFIFPLRIFNTDRKRYRLMLILILINLLAITLFRFLS